MESFNTWKINEKSSNYNFYCFYGGGNNSL